MLLSRDCEQPIGTIPIGELQKHLLSTLKRRHFCPTDQLLLILPQKKLAADEELLYFPTRLKRPPEFPVSFNEKQSSLVACAAILQLYCLFDFRILETCDLKH